MKNLMEAFAIRKKFGGLQAIYNVSFAIREGEILGLIGPNGAGKTTLFNIINGLYEPDWGNVLFEGRNITGLAPDKIVHRGLARTHQIVKPLYGMSVLANVIVGACFGREYMGLRDARTKALEVLQLVGMGDRANSPARSLTIAGKKRLEVARALAASPKLLLLDEVLAGLNPSEITEMIDLVRKIRDSGVSIFMIEHVMQAVMKLSDHLVVLNFGEKLAEGTPEEIAKDPKVIEAYLGDSEIAEKLRREDDGRVVGA